MMSYTRFQQLLASVPANARKVYDAVPVQQAWRINEIGDALQLTGQMMRIDVLQGCLAALKHADLITEIAGRYQRTSHKPKQLELVRPEPAATHQEPAVSSLPISPLPAPEDPAIVMARGLLERAGFVIVPKATYDKDQEAFVRLDDELKAAKAQLAQKADKKTGSEVHPVWKTLGYDFESDFKNLAPRTSRAYKLPAGRTMTAMSQAAQMGARRAMGGQAGWMDSFVDGDILVVVRRGTRSTARDKQAGRTAQTA